MTRRTGWRCGHLLLAILIAALSVSTSNTGQAAEERPVAELLGVLRNERDPQQRLAALWALKKRPSPEVLAAIADVAAKDTDSRVQKDALSVLGEIGRQRPELVSERQLTLAEKLLDPASNTTEQVREQAAACYVSLRGKDAIPKLLQALGQETSPKVRRAILNRGDKFWDALENSPDVLVQAALKDADPLVARFAAQALADIGDARAVETLTLYLEHAPSRKQAGILGRLGRSPRVSLETFAKTLEPWLTEAPLEAYGALCAVRDPRRQAIQPILADLALRLLPHLPPDQKHEAFAFIGDTGGLSYLPILAEGGDPQRLEARYGPIAPDTLGRFSDAKDNGIHSIQRRCLRSQTDLLLSAGASAAERKELIESFPFVWTCWQDGELARVLQSLTSDEAERAVLLLAGQLEGLEKLNESLRKARPQEAALLLVKLFERFVAAGGKPSNRLRYFAHDLAATEHRQAADFLYDQWAKASRDQDAEWQDTVLNALLAFRTPVAEDVTLRLLSVKDIHVRYRAVEQLGRIGTAKAHKMLSAMRRTEPDITFGAGDILLRTHQILDRALADIDQRRRAAGG